MNLRALLNEKFVYADAVAEILEIGFLTGKNVFLYGRGGHAKSEIMNEFLKYVDPTGENSFVQACGEGLTEDKLFGGINMKKFQKDGEIEHLVENSFMNKRFVVFEELLDSRMNVLLSLKDILTSGIFRQGKQQFKIKTEFIVCLTNRTKQEVAEDNSVKALLERFPLEIKVEWPKYERDDYSNMFSKVLKNDYEDVANICHFINESGDFVSPRTAIHMAQVFSQTNSLENLKYFGYSADIIEKIEKQKREKDLLSFIVNKSIEFNNVEYNFNDLHSIKIALSVYKTILGDISSKSYPDSVYSKFNALVQDIENELIKLKNQFLKLHNV